MSKFNIFLFCFLAAILTCLALDGWVLISVWLYIALILMSGIILFIGVVHLPWQFFVPVRFKGSVGEHSISLTFDDGPIPDHTERILDMLAKFKVQATFFLIGNRVEQHPVIVERIIREGHLIGNHSYSHSSTFDLKSTSQMINEMRKTDEFLFRLIEKKIRFFRPPYGVTNPNLAKAIVHQGYVTVGWSVRSLDTVLSSKKVMNRVCKAKAGDIVLFHDYSEATLSILEDFLTYCETIGLKIAPLDSLINERAYG